MEISEVIVERNNHLQSRPDSIYVICACCESTLKICGNNIGIKTEIYYDSNDDDQKNKHLLNYQCGHCKSIGIIKEYSFRLDPNTQKPLPEVKVGFGANSEYQLRSLYNGGFSNHEIGYLIDGWDEFILQENIAIAKHNLAICAPVHRQRFHDQVERSVEVYEKYLNSKKSKTK